MPLGELPTRLAEVPTGPDARGLQGRRPLGVRPPATSSSRASTWSTSTAACSTGRRPAGPWSVRRASHPRCSRSSADQDGLSVGASDGVTELLITSGHSVVAQVKKAWTSAWSAVLTSEPRLCKSVAVAPSLISPRTLDKDLEAVAGVVRDAVGGPAGGEVLAGRTQRLDRVGRVGGPTPADQRVEEAAETAAEVVRARRSRRGRPPRCRHRCSGWHRRCRRRCHRRRRGSLPSGPVRRSLASA